MTATLGSTLPRRVWSVSLRGERVIDQFARFVLVGGVSNVLYGAAFLLLHSDGVLVANVIGSLLSTVLANELHRRSTFHAADRVHWLTAQGEGGGIALLGMVLSTATLALVGVMFPSLAGVLQAALVIAVSGVVGAVRFLALRRWVFSLD